MMLRIQKYSFQVIEQKGKDVVIADSVSRTPQPFTEPFTEEYEVHSVRNLLISDLRIAEPNFTNGSKERKPGLAR